MLTYVTRQRWVRCLNLSTERRKREIKDVDFGNSMQHRMSVDRYAVIRCRHRRGCIFRFRCNKFVLLWARVYHLALHNVGTTMLTHVSNVLSISVFGECARAHVCVEQTNVFLSPSNPKQKSGT